MVEDPSAPSMLISSVSEDELDERAERAASPQLELQRWMEPSRASAAHSYGSAADLSAPHCSGGGSGGGGSVGGGVGNGI